MKHLILIFAAFALCTTQVAFGQVDPDTVKTPSPGRIGVILGDSASLRSPAPGTQSVIPPASQKWYDKISVRGYVQTRYNRLGETNPDLMCDQCDKSWGRNGGVFIRRARVVLSGFVHERVYLYIQPDFASAASGSSLNFGQMRDAYMDLGIDRKSEFRLRLGQSKIPYGFENLQSSQNRLPLDRADPTNSAVANERDLGAFFYWAPSKIRQRFTYLIASGLKGSGDYGVVGLGLFNGQTANRPEANDGMHIVGRVSYPFMLKSGQIIEPGLQTYSGKYVMAEYQLSSGTESKKEYMDERAAASLMIYPQPFDFMAEYNIGRGPEFNPETNTIENKPLEGGYAMAMFKFEMAGQTFIPFSRAQYYKGGKKHELDARRHRVRELEIGIEWQPVPAFELVAMYTISDREFEDFVTPVNRQSGRLLRLQAQLNY